MLVEAKYLKQKRSAETMEGWSSHLSLANLRLTLADLKAHTNVRVA
jgi:hypothetical protein